MVSRLCSTRSVLLHTAVLAVALASIGAACESAPIDTDRDGFSTPTDCDDFNNTIHPEATEIAGDGIDQDCDGVDLPADVVAAEDIDQDGVKAADGDCDDFNNTIHPNAREYSLDHVDSNCDGEDLPALGENRFDEALGLMDTDLDGAISFEEFSAACAASAQVIGEARAGVIQTHASCSGTVSCRGMHLHPWGELFIHDCRGVNYCTGWSCTETAEDQGRTGEQAYTEVGCLNCHSTQSGAFKVEVPPDQDVDATVAAFFDNSDERFRSAIAFGIKGISPSGGAYTNMPAHYELLSRRELDAVIAHIRTLSLEGANFTYADENEPVGAGEE